MNEGIPRSLYAPRRNEQADGGLSIGKGGLPHTIAAKSMAKSFSGTSPWNTEVWCSSDKCGDARRVLEAGGRRIRALPRAKTEGFESFFLIRKNNAVGSKEWTP